MSITENIINVFYWAAEYITNGLSWLTGVTIHIGFGVALLIIIILWVAYLVIRTFERYFFYWLVITTCFYLLTLLAYLRFI